MVTSNGHAPSELAPPVIVLDNQAEPDARGGFHDLADWSPLGDYAARVTDLYIAINHAFHARGVVPDHAMMESLVRATMQSKYAEWITDPAPPPFPLEVRHGHERHRGERPQATATPRRGAGRERRALDERPAAERRDAGGAGADRPD